MLGLPLSIYCLVLVAATACPTLPQVTVYVEVEPFPNLYSAPGVDILQKIKWSCRTSIMLFPRFWRWLEQSAGPRLAMLYHQSISSVNANENLWLFYIVQNSTILEHLYRPFHSFVTSIRGLSVHLETLFSLEQASAVNTQVR